MKSLIKIDLSVLYTQPYSITSVGHGADPGFLTVSAQVTLVRNLASVTFQARSFTFSAKEITPPLTSTILYAL